MYLIKKYLYVIVITDKQSKYTRPLNSDLLISKYLLLTNETTTN